MKIIMENVFKKKKNTFMFFETIFLSIFRVSFLFLFYHSIFNSFNLNVHTAQCLQSFHSYFIREHHFHGTIFMGENEADDEKERSFFFSAYAKIIMFMPSWPLNY